MVIDSDVLIWFLHRNKKAYDIVLTNSPFKISVVNYAELIQGCKNKRVLNSMKKDIMGLDTEIVQINEIISGSAMELIEKYFLSHSLALPDALVASTALYLNEPLLTANAKHYRFIPGLKLEIFRP
jgi:predicted nucleic acid-binding protein